MNAGMKIPAEHIGFYRADTPTGWAAYDKRSGAARHATQDEARTAATE